jgi:hypothetical protein
LADTDAGPRTRGETGSPSSDPTIDESGSPLQLKVVIDPGGGLRLWREAGTSIGREVRVLLTDDLFLGGFALARGGELRGVEVRGVNGRRMAVFQIVGPDLEELERDYYRGAALVNLQLLKLQVRRLKDMAFQAMREEERRDASDEGRDRRDQASERPVRGRQRARD